MSSDIGSCASSLPLLITTMSSAVASISFSKWEEINTARPLAAKSRRKVRSQRMPSGSKAIRWFVQDQVIGIAEHRGSQRQALLHPHGVLPDRLPGDFAEADLAEQLVDPAIACAGRRREHSKVVAAATTGVETRIEHAPDRPLGMRQLGVGEVAKLRSTGRRGDQPDENPHRGGFPRAIGPEKAGYASRLDHEAEIVYGEGAVVALDQPIDDDWRHRMVDGPGGRPGPVYGGCSSAMDGLSRPWSGGRRRQPLRGCLHRLDTPGFGRWSRHRWRPR